MEQAHVFTLTNKQAAKLTSFIDIFYNKAAARNTLPVPMLLLLNGVRRSVIDEDSLDQSQINVLLWSMELLFSQFSEHDMDIELEKCYHKLTGYWYEGFDPWYERIALYDKHGNYTANKGDTDDQEKCL